MVKTLKLMDIIGKIEGRYNGDNDLIPGAPVVTWTDNQLADALSRAVTIIEELNDRITVLEQDKREAEHETLQR